MDKLKKIILKIKDANFEQTLVVLIGVFLLGVIIISLTTTSTGTNNPVVNNGSGVGNTTSNVDPNTISKGQKNLYNFKYGTIQVDGTSGIYYYQQKPTDDEIQTIKSNLGLVTLELVDETYKSTKTVEPVEPTFPEYPVLDQPRPSGDQSIEDGMDGEGLVD